MLLSPDMRSPQYATLGAVLGAVLALPALFFVPMSTVLQQAVLSAIALLACGWYQIRMQPVLPGVPSPPPNLAYSAKVALDDFILASMAWLASVPSREELAEAITETHAAYEQLKGEGFLDAPERFHRQPPPLSNVQLSPIIIRSWRCELLNFSSEFEPHPGLPGAARWLSYQANQTTHTLLLRKEQSAPWLICVHGFGMGSNVKRDFATFRVGELHERFKVNVAMVTLPVHGPRSPGGFNGARFMPLSPVDFVHAESQAIWDLRRLIGWLRSEGATSIGVYGISLGAYTSALLASVEDDLACVIAGVPPSDVLATREHLMSSLERRLMVAPGLDFARYRDVQRVVRPLCFTPKLPLERRYMYAATGDQFVPVEQIHALWQHWQQPRIAWCQGGHVSALGQREPRALVDEAIADWLTANP